MGRHSHRPPEVGGRAVPGRGRQLVGPVLYVQGETLRIYRQSGAAQLSLPDFARLQAQLDKWVTFRSTLDVDTGPPDAISETDARIAALQQQLRRREREPPAARGRRRVAGSRSAGRPLPGAAGWGAQRGLTRSQQVLPFARSGGYKSVGRTRTSDTECWFVDDPATGWTADKAAGVDPLVPAAVQRLIEARPGTVLLRWSSGLADRKVVRVLPGQGPDPRDRSDHLRSRQEPAPRAMS